MELLIMYLGMQGLYMVVVAFLVIHGFWRIRNQRKLP
jgi:hypothetical protein